MRDRVVEEGMDHRWIHYWNIQGCTWLGVIVCIYSVRYAQMKNVASVVQPAAVVQQAVMVGLLCSPTRDSPRWRCRPS